MDCVFHQYRVGCCAGNGIGESFQVGALCVRLRVLELFSWFVSRNCGWEWVRVLTPETGVSLPPVSAMGPSEELMRRYAGASSGLPFLSFPD